MINLLVNIDEKEKSYPIIINNNDISTIKEKINNYTRGTKILVVISQKVDKLYGKTLGFCNSEKIILKDGEQEKNFKNFQKILKKAFEMGLTRKDTIIAVGGGVVGDIAGFAASTYMRGIDFIQVPTTLLACVDSSVGGKTGIDTSFGKNLLGSFYQPKKVIIDPNTLKTLDKRQLHAGLAESIKMSLTSDRELFEIMEKSTDIISDIDTVIVRSLMIKKDVVEKDPKEKGLRRVLNFGHTIGHAIESMENGRLLHGECVALGMIPMCADEVREKLIPVLKKYDLPVSIKLDCDKATELVTHDKKAHGKDISAVYVSKIGEFKMVEMKPDEIKGIIGRCFR